jgi:ABC-type bacteriocin/lantibiotic exporter with double-glycine peptidase domain
VVEGRVAAKLAFEVIDREPQISQSSGRKHQLQGDIKLSNISFYYPTRPD